MRRGVSLLEVTFAILVVSIGLLAALTVFPVASAIAKKGQVADMVAVHGRSAVHDFDARGMRSPANWMAWNQVAGAYQPYAPASNESLCLDPRGIGANPTAQLAMSSFPYSATATQPRMRRLTLNSLGLPMSKAMADSIFVFADDLTMVRPADNSLPGFGTMEQGDSNNDGTPDFATKRSSGGHFSWMATLCPRPELRYDTFTSTQSLNSEYLLTVVVFHDRPMVNLALDTPGSDMYDLGERIADVDWNEAGGLGHAGGESLLIWPIDGAPVPQNAANDEAAAKALKVRGGDWVMLAGLGPRRVADVNVYDVPYFTWYRVVEADGTPEYHAAEQHYAVAVSLAGPDWDTNMVNQRVVIPTGVVACYEKTVRLQ